MNIGLMFVNEDMYLKDEVDKKENDKFISDKLGNENFLKNF